MPPVLKVWEMTTGVLMVCFMLLAVADADEPGTCQPSSGNSLLQAQVKTVRAKINGTLQLSRDLKASESLIRWSLHQDKCLDVDAGRAEDGTNIQIYTCDPGNVNQKFISLDGEGLIRWAGNQDYCLDVDAGSSAAGTNIQLWRCDEWNDNQKFRLRDVGVAYQIQWVKHDRCMDVDAGRNENHVNVQMWHCDSSNPNQLFSLCRDSSCDSNEGGDEVFAGENIEEEMARVAGAVWSLQGSSAGWNLRHSIRQRYFGNDPDYLGIYTRGNRCAVAFQGTSAEVDYLKNFDARTASGCGFGDLHNGFWGALSNFLNDHSWENTLAPFLRSGSCSGGIHATGHSLGAALATIFAACANTHSNPFGFRVNYLWDYAGPGVAKSQLTNGQSGDGGFRGARFWNEQDGLADPVAGVAGQVGFVHAKVKAVQLYGWDHGNCHVYSGDSDSARDSPGFNLVSLSRADELHDINRYYIPRVKRFFTDGRCDGPARNTGGTANIIPNLPGGITNAIGNLNPFNWR